MSEMEKSVRALGGKTYRLALKADPLHRMKNAGEIAIMDWLVDYVDRSDDHTIVIYENGKVPKLLSEWDFDANIDVYTTRAFLHYCEDCCRAIPTGHHIVKGSAGRCFEARSSGSVDRVVGHDAKGQARPYSDREVETSEDW